MVSAVSAVKLAICFLTTEFTEKAETQQVGAWGEERGASSENVPGAEFLVHRGFLRELRVLRGDDCD